MMKLLKRQLSVVWSENEYCAMLIGEYDGSFEMNPEVAYSTKWMDKQEFLTDLEANPGKYSPFLLTMTTD